MKCLWCLKDEVQSFEVKSLTYHRCADCEFVFLNPSHRLSKEDEKARYEKHENDIGDAGYLAFAKPLAQAIKESALPTDKGLDYGSGPDSAIHFLLRDDGYDVVQYDPFFKPDDLLLTKKYDYIILSEVAEHLYDPKNEFEKLERLLNDGGTLFVMTSLLFDGLDFANWSYRRDSTHVCFYSEKTFARKYKTQKLADNLIKLST